MNKYVTLNKRLNEDHVNELGVKRDNKGKFVFGYKKNNEFEDFLFIHKDLKVKKTFWGNEYYFSYEYNSKSEKYRDFVAFRDMLKNGKLKKFYKDEYDRFIEYPIEYLAERTTLYHLDAIFYPQSQTALFDDLVNKIKFYDSEFDSSVSHKSTIIFEVLKRNWKDVQFDDQAYFDWLTTKMKSVRGLAEQRRQEALEKFNKLKERGENNWFQMTAIIPRDIRPFVRNFFYFNDEQLNKLKSIDNPEFLIIDDILATGSTTDEISKMLREINNKCKIIRFVLIDMGL